MTWLKYKSPVLIFLPCQRQCFFPGFGVNIQDSTFHEADCCGNLQPVRPEACWASFQTSDGAHKRAFPYSHIEESTIPHLINQMGPLSLQKGASYCKFPLC